MIQRFFHSLILLSALLYCVNVGYAKLDGDILIDDLNTENSKDEGAEYLIISGDVTGFKGILEELMEFRIEQGISTILVTTTEIGGSTSELIENYIDNAWNTWDVPPLAILFVGDYDQIPSPPYSKKGEKTDVSDNYYADVDKDDIPDIAVSRLTFTDAYILENYIYKIMNYELNPPENPGYYDNPVTSMGWFNYSNNMICAEATYGFFQNEMGKWPQRENAIGLGIPGNDWTCSPNLISLFGPSGLNYVQATPEYLVHWGANADSINENLNNGAFFITNLDSGTEYGWSYPEYWTSDLVELFYSEPFFVVSINNLNGKFNWSFDCFAEAILNNPNGAAGIIASSLNLSTAPTTEYYIYLVDGLWENFIPDFNGNYHPYPFVLPAFANVSSKLVLSGSGIQNKENIYYGFHYFGEPFVPVTYNIPDTLEVAHDYLFDPGISEFQVAATEGSTIAISMDKVIQSVSTGTGEPIDMAVFQPTCDDTLVVTVTKQNYVRYRQEVLCNALVIPTGIQAVEFAVSPNPVKDFVEIDFNDQPTGTYSVIVYDAYGNIVLSKRLHPETNTINLSTLRPGVYYLNVVSGSHKGSKKIVILD